MPYPSNPIDQLMADTGNVASNDPNLRNTLEYFLPAIRKNGVASTAAISLSDGDRYKGDFFGLLASLQVGEDLYWITMRLNGLAGPDLYDGLLTQILIADPGYYARVVAMYQSNKKEKQKEKA